MYFLIAVNKTSESTISSEWVMLSKERLKKGFDDLERSFGLDSFRLNQYAKLSCRRNDVIPCKETLNRIGDDWNHEVWGKTEFDRMKQFASLASAAQEKDKPQISGKSKTQQP
jgi:hypothetical protein